MKKEKRILSKSCLPSYRYPCRKIGTILGLMVFLTLGSYSNCMAITHPILMSAPSMC